MIIGDNNVIEATEMLIDLSMEERDLLLKWHHILDSQGTATTFERELSSLLSRDPHMPAESAAGVVVKSVTDIDALLIYAKTAMSAFGIDTRLENDVVLGSRVTEHEILQCIEKGLTLAHAALRFYSMSNSALTVDEKVRRLSGILSSASAPGLSKMKITATVAVAVAVAFDTSVGPGRRLREEGEEGEGEFDRAVKRARDERHRMVSYLSTQVETFDDDDDDDDETARLSARRRARPSSNQTVVVSDNTSVKRQRRRQPASQEFSDDDEDVWDTPSSSSSLSPPASPLVAKRSRSRSRSLVPRSPSPVQPPESVIDLDTPPSPTTAPATLPYFDDDPRGADDDDDIVWPSFEMDIEVPRSPLASVSPPRQLTPPPPPPPRKFREGCPPPWMLPSSPCPPKWMHVIGEKPIPHYKSTAAPVVIRKAPAPDPAPAPAPAPATATAPAPTPTRSSEFKSLLKHLEPVRSKAYTASHKRFSEKATPRDQEKYKKRQARWEKIRTNKRNLVEDNKHDMVKAVTKSCTSGKKLPRTIQKIESVVGLTSKISVHPLYDALADPKFHFPKLTCSWNWQAKNPGEPTWAERLLAAFLAISGVAPPKGTKIKNKETRRLVRASIKYGEARRAKDKGKGPAASPSPTVSSSSTTKKKKKKKKTYNLPEDTIPPFIIDILLRLEKQTVDKHLPDITAALQKAGGENPIPGKEPSVSKNMVVKILDGIVAKIELKDVDWALTAPEELLLHMYTDKIRGAHIPTHNVFVRAFVNPGERFPHPDGDTEENGELLVRMIETYTTNKSTDEFVEYAAFALYLALRQVGVSTKRFTDYSSLYRAMKRTPGNSAVLDMIEAIDNTYERSKRQEKTRKVPAPRTGGGGGGGNISREERDFSSSYASELSVLGRNLASSETDEYRHVTPLIALAIDASKQYFALDKKSRTRVNEHKYFQKVRDEFERVLSEKLHLARAISKAVVSKKVEGSAVLRNTIIDQVVHEEMLFNIQKSWTVAKTAQYGKRVRGSIDSVLLEHVWTPWVLVEVVDALNKGEYSGAIDAVARIKSVSAEYPANRHPLVQVIFATGHVPVFGGSLLLNVENAKKALVDSAAATAAADLRKSIGRMLLFFVAVHSANRDRLFAALEPGESTRLHDVTNAHLNAIHPIDYRNVIPSKFVVPEGASSCTPLLKAVATYAYPANDAGSVAVPVEVDAYTISYGREGITNDVIRDAALDSLSELYLDHLEPYDLHHMKKAAAAKAAEAKEAGYMDEEGGDGDDFVDDLVTRIGEFIDFFEDLPNTEDNWKRHELAFIGLFNEVAGIAKVKVSAGPSIALPRMQGSGEALTRSPINYVTVHKDAATAKWFVDGDAVDAYLETKRIWLTGTSLDTASIKELAADLDKKVLEFRTLHHVSAGVNVDAAREKMIKRAPSLLMEINDSLADLIDIQRRLMLEQSSRQILTAPISVGTDTAEKQRPPTAKEKEELEDFPKPTMEGPATVLKSRRKKPKRIEDDDDGGGGGDIIRDAVQNFNLLVGDPTLRYPLSTGISEVDAAVAGGNVLEYSARLWEMEDFPMILFIDEINAAVGQAPPSVEKTLRTFGARVPRAQKGKDRFGYAMVAKKPTNNLVAISYLSELYSNIIDEDTAKKIRGISEQTYLDLSDAESEISRFLEKQFSMPIKDAGIFQRDLLLETLVSADHFPQLGDGERAKLAIRFKTAYDSLYNHEMKLTAAGYPWKLPEENPNFTVITDKVKNYDYPVAAKHKGDIMAVDDNDLNDKHISSSSLSETIDIGNSVLLRRIFFLAWNYPLNQEWIRIGTTNKRGGVVAAAGSDPQVHILNHYKNHYKNQRAVLESMAVRLFIAIERTMKELEENSGAGEVESHVTETIETHKKQLHNSHLWNRDSAAAASLLPKSAIDFVTNHGTDLNVLSFIYAFLVVKVVPQPSLREPRRRF